MRELPLNQIIHGDCLEVMRGFPDKSIDLVLTDPPYGIDIGSMNFTNSTIGGVAKRKDYKGMADWDKFSPSKEYFNEILRVGKKVVIFGGQYFTDKLPQSNCWVVWDKRVDEKYNNDFADCELVWTSESKPSRVIRYLWSGMMQGDMKNKEERLHPTQKPIPVISQLLGLFSEEGGGST